MYTYIFIILIAILNIINFNEYHYLISIILLTWLYIFICKSFVDYLLLIYHAEN